MTLPRGDDSAALVRAPSTRSGPRRGARRGPALSARTIRSAACTEHVRRLGRSTTSAPCGGRGCRASHPGIGFATAKALLARGARVVIGDREVALQESAVAGLGKHGQVSGYPLDVTDRESFATFLDKARTDGIAGSAGHIDVLINNAGVMPIDPFLEQSEQSTGRRSR